MLTKDGAAQPITAESTVMAAKAPRAPANTCGRQVLKLRGCIQVQAGAGSLLNVHGNLQAAVHQREMVLGDDDCSPPSWSSSSP